VWQFKIYRITCTTHGSSFRGVCKMFFYPPIHEAFPYFLKEI